MANGIQKIFFNSFCNPNINCIAYLCNQQMKKGLTLLVSMLLAAVIVYGGSGVNVYFFCGNDCCNGKGFAVLTGCDCGNMTGGHKCECCMPMDEAKGCCSMSDAAGDHSRHTCKMERISVNWQPVQSEKWVSNPASFHLFFDSVRPSINPLESVCDTSPWQQTASQKPPNLSKDLYFSLLNILII